MYRTSSDVGPLDHCVREAVSHLDPRIVPTDHATFSRWWDADAVVYTCGERQCEGIRDVVEHYVSFARRFVAAEVSFRFLAAADELVTAEFRITASGRGAEPDVDVYVHASFLMRHGRIHEMRQVASPVSPPQA